VLGKFEAAAEPNPAAEGSAASQSRQAVERVGTRKPDETFKPGLR
jgi:hypothetical protein